MHHLHREEITLTCQVLQDFQMTHLKWIKNTQRYHRKWKYQDRDWILDMQEAMEARLDYQQAKWATASGPWKLHISVCHPACANLIEKLYKNMHHWSTISTDMLRAFTVGLLLYYIILRPCLEEVYYVIKTSLKFSYLKTQVGVLGLVENS